MKVVISLEKVPLTIEIEGSDDAMSEIGTIVEATLARMKKVWLDSLKRQRNLLMKKQRKVRNEN